LDTDVPDGKDEENNEEIRSYLEPTKFDFSPKSHFELGESMGLMDFETAATIAGSRFVILKGALTRLERAIAQFMIDTHTEKFGYTEISTPLLVNDHTMFGTGQLPKFAEDSFKTTNGYWLIPTAEVSVTNTASGKILSEDSLPQRYVCYSPCFRSEAGSAGRDTRGMLRQHQFYKVELVSIVHPDTSNEEHERMTKAAEEILKQLKLPFRTMKLCSQDTGFCAKKTHDLEAWLPGQNAYREISSCSTCGDFQARRMNARFRPNQPDKSKPEFVHTLNGSGLAVGRTLIAVMENYQTKEGGVVIPEVLRQYMKNAREITKDGEIR
jgi:seryl-tRNA synthetase